MSNKAEEKHSISPIIRNIKTLIFKGQNYLINFDSIKINSNYFYSNCDKFTEENIEIEEEIDISEFTFQSFINCCQNKEFIVNESNVFQLDYLSKKYEVPELTKITQEFISRPNTKLAFESLHFKIQLQNDCKTKSKEEVQFIDTSNEEEIIGDRLNEYLNEERLSDFPIPIIHRILTKYMNKNKESNSNEIIEFLFKCLDKHKRKASVLFLNIDIDKQPKDLFIRLMRDYNDTFDFNMINLKTILNTTSELTKELITIKEEYNERINEMKQIIVEQKEEIKQFNESRSLIDKELKVLIEEQKAIISEQKKEIEKINESIETKLNNFMNKQEQNNEQQKNEMNKMIEEQKNEIKRNNESIETKINNFMNKQEQNNEQQKKEISKMIEEQKNEIRKKDEEINQKINKTYDDQKKEINKIIEEQKNEIKRKDEEQTQKINRINDEQKNIKGKLQSTVSTQQVRNEIINQTKDFITKQIQVHIFYQISSFVSHVVLYFYINKIYFSFV